jgi:hypothetical protein
MFTIKMDGIPYCNSVHFVRHKYGVEHYVQSQRKNPDRGAERQDAPVTHIMDINAQELIFMARKRLCYKADRETRLIMTAIKDKIEDKDFSLWNDIFLPQCRKQEKNCTEFKPCGMFRRMTEWAISNEQTALDAQILQDMIKRPLINPLTE